MEKTLLVNDQTARRIYPTAAPELQQILENTFPKGFFSKNIMEIVISFEAACEYNNTNPKAKKFTQGTRNQIYQERVAEIVKALNQGWIANYNDPKEYKYAPYFLLNAPGFRFYDTYCVITSSNSTGGSRFALKTRELAEFAGKHFTKEYEYWLMPDPNEVDEKACNLGASKPKPFSGTMEEWEKYIMERVNSFENACAEIGEDPDDEKYQDDEADDDAYKKGKLVCKVLNGPFEHLMKDMTSRKWYAWMEKTDTGFRFCGTDCVIASSRAAGGSRLRLCSEKLAKHFGTKFAGMMAPYWWNE